MRTGASKMVKIDKVNEHTTWWSVELVYRRERTDTRDGDVSYFADAAAAAADFDYKKWLAERYTSEHHRTVNGRRDYAEVILIQWDVIRILANYVKWQHHDAELADRLLYGYADLQDLETIISFEYRDDLMVSMDVFDARENKGE